MALIKTGTETATVTETENVTETVTAPAAETKDVAVKETAAAPAVASKPGSFWLTSPAIQQIVDEADTQTFDRIVGSSGNLKLYSTNKSVGNWITFQVMAEKRKRSVSPNGPQGDTEQKQYFAAAYDNQLSSRGNDIEEDLAIAKDAGYDKAKISEYLDLYVMVVATADESSDLVGEIVTIQLASVAKSAWISFKSGLQIKAEMGMLNLGNDGKPPVLKAFAKAETNSRKQDFTTIKFALA